MWATDPLAVSWHTSLITTSGPRARTMSIEAFFRLIGRAMGRINPSAGDIRANSSESNRQPRCTRAAQSVLLPDPGSAASTNARPSRSTTAACSTRQSWACDEMTQFRPHSSIGIAWAIGRGLKGTRPSQRRTTCGRRWRLIQPGARTSTSKST